LLKLSDSGEVLWCMFFRSFSDVSRTRPSTSRDGTELQFGQPGRPSGRGNQLPFGPVGQGPTEDDVIAIDTTGRGRTEPRRDAGTRRRMPLRCPTGDFVIQQIKTNR
jgi:hypothetical protein